MEKLCPRSTKKLEKPTSSGNEDADADQEVKQTAASKAEFASNSGSHYGGHRNSSSPSPTAVKSRLATLAQIGEDWLYLALLGTIMAMLSFSMDTVITLFLNTRLWLFNDLSKDNRLVQYMGWCLTPIVLVTFSSAFVHLCSPTAIGSGIPEMKTILRGVVLNEYLTFRTLVAKIVGLTFTLGSGLPLGKEGPFVHMASIVATLLSKLVASFQGIYENESRTSEMLSAACAVGVAATFYAPIGGVLFSIEVTTVYFAVRNYWRGFFAACCGATIWRLLGFWIKNDESISALFKTNFRTDYPFDPLELLMFSFIGVTCGLAGAAYIKFHREIVQFFRRHKRISGFLQQNRFVYPVLVTLVITSVTFPPFIGKYTASTLSTHTTIEHLFSNRTWSNGNVDLVSKEILDHWTTPNTDFHLHLVLYILMLFWTSALASTIPIPSGLFIPVLKMGAAYGRLLGELMHQAFPNGIKYGEYVHPANIIPGSYAVVGAAAFSGAVTHTISTSVILFEMTGQIVHIIPVILGVLIANAVCQSLQPSIYDSIIEIKKLPYLPPIASSNSVSHRILVKDFMNTNLAYVWKEKCNYGDLKALLIAHPKIISFPLVESPHSMKLLGSVSRPDLLKLLYLHLGRERRLQEVCRRNSDTLKPAIQFLNTISGRLISEERQRKQKLFPQLATTWQADRSLDMSGNTALVADRGFEFRAKRVSTSSEASGPASDSSESPTDLNGVAESSQPAGVRDSSRRILQANAPVNYGATTSDLSAGEQLITAKTQLARRQALHLNLIAQADMTSSEEEHETPSHGVAKIINHYDRGSAMDEDQLDRSKFEIRSQLAAVKESPEIVVALPVNPGKPNDYQACDLTSCKHHKSYPPKAPTGRALVRAVSPSELGRMSPTRPLTPQLKSATSFNTTPAESPSLSSRPKKSILKTSSTATSLSKMYRRNLSSASFSSALVTIDGKPQQHQLSPGELSTKQPSVSISMNERGTDRAYHSTGEGANFTLGGDTPVELTPVRQRRKVRLPQLRVVDMTPEEQEDWEREQLNAHIDINKCQIDEAPFQLVEQTSLYRVHTLFSMLGLNHAYVTSFGRLVGIVALKDIRFAIERVLQDK